MNEQADESSKPDDEESNVPTDAAEAAERPVDETPAELNSSAGASAADEMTPTPDAVIPSWRPADYYALPPAPARFPRWVPIAAGISAIVALAFMTVVGMFLQSGGLSKLIAIAIGQLNSEAGRMFDDDVDAAARASFSKSLLAVRDGIADGQIDLTAALPVLQQMQKATRDEHLSAAEVDDLTTVFEATRATPAKAPPGEPPVVDL